MIQKELLKVTSICEIAKETYEMKLMNENISKTVKPGQFLHIQVEGFTLRRPISIADVDQEKQEITIIFKRFGEGTKKLSTFQEGTMINALGPLGNGFPMDSSLNKVLLIGGGVGVPPLYYLGKKFAKNGIEVETILGFQNKDSVFYEEKFHKFGPTHLVTNDGSYGKKGYVTAVFHAVKSFDQYYACGPLPMLKSIQQEFFQKKGYISLEERMGCGVGVCFACVVPTDKKGGYRKICQDGPVFAGKEVIL